MKKTKIEEIPKSKKKVVENITKLEKILRNRNMSQGDLMRIIKSKSGFRIGRDRISKICSGVLKNYHLETAVMISEALNVPIQDIVELKDVKKDNPKIKRRKNDK